MKSVFQFLVFDLKRLLPGAPTELLSTVPKLPRLWKTYTSRKWGFLLNPQTLDSSTIGNIFYILIIGMARKRVFGSKFIKFES